MQHKCEKCNTNITYIKEEVFCSECGRKNFRYLTNISDINNIDSKVDFRIKEIFKDDPQYLYYLMDSYNGVGQIYRTVIRLDTYSIESTYWSQDKKVSIKVTSKTLKIIKSMDKTGITGFNISTSIHSNCQFNLDEILRTYPINGINMHHTSEDIKQNIRAGILNKLTGLYFKESTKEIFDKYMKVNAEIEKALEFIQPHPKQRL